MPTPRAKYLREETFGFQLDGVLGMVKMVACKSKAKAMSRLMEKPIPPDSIAFIRLSPPNSESPASEDQSRYSSPGPISNPIKPVDPPLVPLMNFFLL